MIPPQPISTLFPYTTLFRSHFSLPVGELDVQSAHPSSPSPFLCPKTHSGAKKGGALAQIPETKGEFMIRRDRKSTRLNSSHEWISYAVFCLKKKKKEKKKTT